MRRRWIVAGVFVLVVGAGGYVAQRVVSERDPFGEKLGAKRFDGLLSKLNSVGLLSQFDCGDEITVDDRFSMSPSGSKCYIGGDLISSKTWKVTGRYAVRALFRKDEVEPFLAQIIVKPNTNAPVFLDSKESPKQTRDSGSLKSQDRHLYFPPGRYSARATTAIREAIRNPKTLSARFMERDVELSTGPNDERTLSMYIPWELPYVDVDVFMGWDWNKEYYRKIAPKIAELARAKFFPTAIVKMQGPSVSPLPHRPSRSVIGREYARIIKGDSVLAKLQLATGTVDHHVHVELTISVTPQGEEWLNPDVKLLRDGGWEATDNPPPILLWFADDRIHVIYGREEDFAKGLDQEVKAFKARKKSEQPGQ